MGPLTRSSNGTVFDIIPSSKRTRVLYFSGGKQTNTRRPGQVAYIRRTLNETVSGSFGGSRTYIDDLRSSVFCINIRGTSAECFRFYESIEAGCIPLMLNQYHDFNYAAQHEHQYSLLLEAEWGRKGYPFLWVNDAAELRRVYAELLRSGPEGLARLDAMQADMLVWYDKVKTHFGGAMSREMCRNHSASSYP